MSAKRTEIHERVPIGPRAGMSDVDVRSIAGMAQEIERVARKPNKTFDYPFQYRMGEHQGLIGLWCHGQNFWICSEETMHGDDPRWNTVWISHSTIEEIRRGEAHWFSKGNSCGALAYYLDCVMSSFGLPKWRED